MPGLEMTPRDQMTVELLRCFPWGGLDLTSTPSAIPDGKGANNSNILPNRTFGAFAPIRGRNSIVSSAGLPGVAQSMGIYPWAQNATTATTYLMISSNIVVSGNALALYTVQPGVGLAGPLTLPPAQFSGAVPYGGGGGSWANAQQWTFFTTKEPNAQIFKFDSLNVTYWQIAPPLLVGPQVVGSNNPNVRVGGAGLITATNLYYTFTYANAIQESGAAWGTAPVGPQAWGGINPVAQTVLMDISTSNDPQVTTINIYRLDDANAQFIYVGSVPNTSGYGGAAAGFARFTDNTPDANVAGQTLLQRRDTPAPFYDITYYMGRMFGFGHDAFTPYWCIPTLGSNGASNKNYQIAGPSDLWYSNYNEPWGWNSVTQVIQVNPNVYGDVAVGVRGAGGVLVLFKTRSSWLLYGDSPDNFQTPIELGSQLGCMSKNSIVSALGTLYWVSNQGVMFFDGSNLENISDDLKGFLDTLTQADLQATAGAYHDGMYVLSFPTKNITYIYYPKTKSWYASSINAILYAFQLEDPSLRTGGGASSSVDVVYGVSSDPLTPALYYIQEFFCTEGADIIGGGTGTHPIVSSWASKVWKPEIASYWVFDYIQLDAATQLAPSTSVLVNIITNPNSASAVTTPIPIPIAGLNNPRQIYHLPEGIEGMSVQIQVVVTNTLNGNYFVLEDVKLYGHMIRKMDEGDNN